MYNSNKISKKGQNSFSIKSIALAFLFTMFYSFNSSAQCAMCRAVLETEEGGVKAEAVNDGIVYLMAFPYILVGVIFYIIYKSRKKAKA
ncbi:hypothetical protein FLAN108750_03625 [Flavobacterium antarcticum]|uniref:hypothetical protein n=2 Tax=Flavobacterium antarcticum TaxID=271155 RepID=UPI0003B6D853